jgi:hypothetical protein
MKLEVGNGKADIQSGVQGRGGSSLCVNAASASLRRRGRGIAVHENVLQKWVKERRSLAPIRNFPGPWATATRATRHRPSAARGREARGDSRKPLQHDFTMRSRRNNSVALVASARAKTIGRQPVRSSGQMQPEPTLIPRILFRPERV